jgi:hypothetical protein
MQIVHIPEATVPLQTIFFNNTFFEQLSAVDKSTTIVGSIQVEKQLRCLSLIARISISNFSEGLQLQETIEASYYPLRSNRLSFRAAVLSNTELEATNTEFGFGGGVSFRPIDRLQATFDYYQGDILYFNERNGQVINNSLDIMNRRFIFAVRGDISKRVQFFALYVNENRTGQYYVESISPVGPSELSIVDQEYNYHAIFSGFNILF